MGFSYGFKLFGGGGAGGGSGSPGGSNTQVQFNNAGAFGGDSGLTYNAATQTLTVPTVTGRNVTLTALATPTITSVTPVGTTGATTYGYKVVALAADGTGTAASAQVTTATGNATLSGTNYNTVLWGAVTGATQYKLYRTAGVPSGGSAAPRLLYTGPLLTFNDTAATDSSETPAAANTTGRVVTGTSTTAASLDLGGSGSGFRLRSSPQEIVWTYLGFVGGVLSNGAVRVEATGNFGWGSGAAESTTTDTFLSRGAAPATLQLGAAASATPVAQTLQAQPGSGTDIAGATPFKITASKGTGAGTPGSLSLQTSVRGTTGTTLQTASDRFYISGNEKTLTLGSNTNFVRIDFPASSTISVGIEYNVNVYDTASPPEFKAHGGRYGVSAYRKSTGNAVAGTVVETLESAVQSVGNAMTDSFTVTGDANGILIGTNVSVGSGLTGSPVGTLRYTVSVNGSGAATVTPQ